MNTLAAAAEVFVGASAATGASPAVAAGNLERGLLRILVKIPFLAWVVFTCRA